MSANISDDVAPTCCLFVKNNEVYYEAYDSWLMAQISFERYCEVYPETVCLVSGGETVGFHRDGKRVVELDSSALRRTFKVSKVFDYRYPSPEIVEILSEEERAKLPPEALLGLNDPAATKKPKAKRTKKTTTTATEE